MKARELAAKYGIEIGCGDNSCMFGSPGGMATNGGCHCMPRGMSKANVTDDELQELRTLVRVQARLLRTIAELES